jgi:hypothetical protein
MAERARGADLDRRLHAIVEHVVQRLADAAVQDMQARYDLGGIVQHLRQRSPFGGGTVQQFADLLGVDPTAVRRYAGVFATIPPREFAWMTRLRSRRGEPLTWSHVELLARIGDAERRKKLATAVVRDGLSVRDLARRVVAR